MNTGQHASSRATDAKREDAASSALFALACIGLGFLVVALAFFAALMWSDANDARNAAERAAAKAGSGDSMATPAQTAVSDLKSFAGAAPANADALATAHKTFPAELPAVPAGAVAAVNLVLKDVEIQVAQSSTAPGPGPEARPGRSSTSGKASW